LLTHKLGEDIADCQDAISLDAVSGHVAIADGATESFAAREWAQHLVQTYVDLKVAARFDQSTWLYEAQQLWAKGISEDIARGRGDIFLINNFNEKRSAYSTFLALSFSALHDRLDLLSIEAEAIGDSCLLHFSGGKLKRAFPLESSAAFSDHPHAISSRQPLESLELAQLKFEVTEGDRILLATDAFAMFLLKAVEADSPVIAEFLALGEQEALKDFVQNQRCKMALQNDDIALVSLHCGPVASVMQDFTFSTNVTKQTDPQSIEHRQRTIPNYQPPSSDPAIIESRHKGQDIPVAKQTRFRQLSFLAFTLIWFGTLLGLLYEHKELNDLQHQLTHSQRQLKEATDRANRAETSLRQLRASEQQSNTPKKNSPTGSTVGTNFFRRESSCQSLPCCEYSPIPPTARALKTERAIETVSTCEALPSGVLIDLPECT